MALGTSPSAPIIANADFPVSTAVVRRPQRAAQPGRAVLCSKYHKLATVSSRPRTGREWAGTPWFELWVLSWRRIEVAGGHAAGRELDGRAQAR